MSGPVNFLRRPELDHPALIVSWLTDSVGVGERVTAFLNRTLQNEVFCEIGPAEFFPLEGVTLDDDVIQFPETRFYAGQCKNVVVLRSTPPRFDWHRFLQTVLDVAQECQAREIYIVGGMVSLIPHAAPRQLLGTFSTADVKETFAGYDLDASWNYETPPGQRPTLNSYLLWAARQRHIPAVSVWVPVPFYIATSGDPRGELKVLEFFNRRLDLCLQLDSLDEEVRQQNRAIASLRRESTEIDAYISRLESGETLSAEESQQLVTVVEKSLSRNNL